METQLILEHVSKHIALEKDQEQLFLSLLEKKRLKKREIFLQAGEVCKHSTFIVSGALKGFTVDKTGTEHVLNFAVQDWWIADLYSLISQKAGTLTIEALADTEVLMLRRDRQEELFLRVPKFERFFRILIEKSLVASQQRLMNNLSLTAEERYQDFMRKYPFILECAPLHAIASYLGITPEFLSKVRRRIAMSGT